MISSKCDKKLIVLTAISAFAFLAIWISGYSLALNPSISMPRGIYLLTPFAVPGRGDVVSACISNLDAAAVYRERGYMVASKRCPSGLPPVMKPIAAVSGDSVEVTAEGVFVNGKLTPKSRIFDTDSDGKKIDHLPLGWKKVLGADEFFLLANYIERSLDSRYYGLVSLADINGRVSSIYTIDRVEN